LIDYKDNRLFKEENVTQDYMKRSGENNVDKKSDLDIFFKRTYIFRKDHTYKAGLLTYA
jgi:hypothetical protein